MKKTKGQVMCEKCGEAPAHSKVLTSSLLRKFTNVPYSGHKQVSLCFKCTREFSRLAAGRVPK